MGSIYSISASLHSDRRRLRSDSKHCTYIYVAITWKVENLNVLCLFPFYSKTIYQIKIFLPYNRKGGRLDDYVMYIGVISIGLIRRSVSINRSGRGMASNCSFSADDHR